MKWILRGLDLDLFKKPFLRLGFILGLLLVAPGVMQNIDAQTLETHIPKDAITVFNVDPRNIDSKVNMERVRSMEWYQDSDQKMKEELDENYQLIARIYKEPRAIGVDMSKPFYFYYNYDSTYKYHHLACFLIPISNAKSFTKYITKLINKKKQNKVYTYKKIKYVLLDGFILGIGADYAFINVAKNFHPEYYESERKANTQLKIIRTLDAILAVNASNCISTNLSYKKMYTQGNDAFFWVNYERVMNIYRSEMALASSLFWSDPLYRSWYDKSPIFSDPDLFKDHSLGAYLNFNKGAVHFDVRQQLSTAYASYFGKILKNGSNEKLLQLVDRHRVLGLLSYSFNMDELKRIATENLGTYSGKVWEGCLEMFFDKDMDQDPQVKQYQKQIDSLYGVLYKPYADSAAIAVSLADSAVKAYNDSLEMNGTNMAMDTTALNDDYSYEYSDSMRIADSLAAQDYYENNDDYKDPMDYDQNGEVSDKESKRYAKEQKKNEKKWKKAAKKAGNDDFFDMNSSDYSKKGKKKRQSDSYEDDYEYFDADDGLYYKNNKVSRKLEPNKEEQNDSESYELKKTEFLTNSIDISNQDEDSSIRKTRDLIDSCYSWKSKRRLAVGELKAKEMNITPELLWNIPQGDVLIAMTDLKYITKYYTSYDYDENDVSIPVQKSYQSSYPLMLFALTVNNPDLVRKLVDYRIKDLPGLKKISPDYYILEDTSQREYTFHIRFVENYVYFTNDSAIGIGDFKGYGPDKQLAPEVMEKLKSNNLHFYMDLHNIFAKVPTKDMEGVTYDALMVYSEALKNFMTYSNYVGGTDSQANARLNFVDAEENSLFQIFNMINRTYLIYKIKYQKK